MQPTDLLVEVRDRALVRRAQVPTGVLDVSATLRLNAPGEWRLRLPVEHPTAGLLRQRGAGVIVSHAGTGVVLWSGPVESTLVEAGTDDPAGMLTVTGVTDDVLLWHRLCYPDPSRVATAQTTTSHDVRTGTAEDVIRAYVDANCGPSALVARRAVTLAPSLGRGSVVPYQARWDILGDALAVIGSRGGVGFRLAQDGSALRLECDTPVDRRAEVRLDLANAGLASQSSETTRRQVTHMVVLGQDEGVARTTLERVAGDAAATVADYGVHGRREAVMDQRQSDDVVELEQAGDEALAEAAGSVVTTLVPGDDVDAWDLLGDLITVVVDGVETSAQVTSVALVCDVDGVRWGVGVGGGEIATAYATVARVSGIESRVSSLERNAESTPPPRSVSPGDAWSLAAGWTLQAGAIRVAGGVLTASLIAQKATAFANGDTVLTLNPGYRPAAYHGAGGWQGIGGAPGPVGIQVGGDGVLTAFGQTGGNNQLRLTLTYPLA